MAEGTTKSGKGSGATEALGKPGMYKGSLKGTGLNQAAAQKTTSDGGSKTETLRQGSMPKFEAVRQVNIDKSCQKSALRAWQASNGDAHKSQAREGAKD